ncbi:SYF2-domain-containing protein [Schizopora paradoxa]|uniref:Pre-mRNA-splicing factor SYF2 n=1 Tax=Schizopora paradoxa TaxID=27342 RepID=A0A0H2R4I5_9AGAM|nr:SYF2-domain-containing protein [Schizopora paradoxa]
MAGTRKKSTRKGKAKVQPKDRSPVDDVEVVEVAGDVGTVESVAEAAKEFVEEMTSTKPEEPREEKAEQPVVKDKPATMEVVEEVVEEQKEETPAATEEKEGEAQAPAMTMEDRKKKLDLLRKRMQDSARQNRTAVIEESTKLKTSAREQARREKQMKLAEVLRTKAEAEERGEDLDRKKNWEYTIEENDEWEKKKRRKERNADFEFHDEEQQARRRYKKDLVHLKPDLASYNKQKELALGLAPGSLEKNGSSSSSALMNFNPQGGALTYEQQQASETLYRDANTLLYADNKPTDEAIDRVINKLNIDQDKRNKFSRKRLNEDEGDITYINERNRVFNKKIARYYDKYTEEIRASFERGTAL